MICYKCGQEVGNAKALPELRGRSFRIFEKCVTFPTHIIIWGWNRRA